jgi:MFS family permease
MAQLVLQLDFSIVNVALPQMQRQLGFSNASLQWIVTGYALLFGSPLLLGGKAGDVWGRRRVLLAGLSLFGISSLTSGLAQAPWILVVSRFLQGGSGAFIAPTALSLLTATFSEGTARQRALGM